MRDYMHSWLSPSINKDFHVFLKIKTLSIQKCFFCCCCFFLEDLLIKVLGKYWQGWEMEKTHYLPENPYLY